MKRLRLIFAALTIAPLAAFSPADGGEAPWTLRFDFNEGAEGQKVAGLDAGGWTKYSTEQVFEGKQAAILHASKGRDNWGMWGGRVRFPKKLRKGDQVWWRVSTYWPKGMDYSADPRLKFLRIHTCTAAGKNRGYNDIYINKPGSKTPFRYIYEGENHWSLVGAAKDAIVPDRWETYEFYVKLDDRAAADGGEARIRFWKNGRLLADITDRKTLKEPDDYADAALLFTYWNSSVHARQVVYEEGGGPLNVGESVTCPDHPDLVYRVKQVRPEEQTVFLQSTAKWKTPQYNRRFDALVPEKKLIGADSGKTCVVREVLHSHPTMDITMYVDDMLITNETPQARDGQGNPFLGIPEEADGNTNVDGAVEPENAEGAPAARPSSGTSAGDKAKNG